VPRNVTRQNDILARAPRKPPRSVMTYDRHGDVVCLDNAGTADVVTIEDNGLSLWSPFFARRS
jgi:hypothetical protein